MDLSDDNTCQKGLTAHISAKGFKELKSKHGQTLEKRDLWQKQSRFFVQCAREKEVFKVGERFK